MSPAPLALNKRSQGWLRHVYRKAMTPDDWTRAGEPNKRWDQYSTPPMLNFPRFDLSESTYPLALMADVTPAWREVYAQILDQLIARHTTFWAAVCWASVGNWTDPETAGSALRAAWSTVPAFFIASSRTGRDRPFSQMFCPSSV